MSSLPFRSHAGQQPVADVRLRARIAPQTRFFVCIFLAVALYFIAGSIGSGFMFLLSSMMVAAIVIGWLYPLLAIHALQATVRAPRTATADEAFPMAVVLQPRLQNKWLASMLDPRQVLIRHYFDHPLPGKLYEHLVERRPEQRSTVQLADSGLPRGVHRLTVALSTAFPLGLVFCERLVRGEEETVVYPAIYPMEGFFLYRLPSLGSGAFGFPREGSSRQSTFTRSLRKYVRGDSPRNIHWPSTARSGELMVREFDAEGMPYFDIVFDLTANWTTPAQFELAVSTVASLVSLGQKMGMSPELKLTPSIDELSLNLPQSLPGYEMQMEILARVMPRPKATSQRATRATETAEHGQATDQRAFKRSRERTPLLICPLGGSDSAPNAFVIEIAPQGTQPASGGINRLSIQSASELQEI